MYHHYAGFIECCGCSLVNPEDGETFGFFHAYTARAVLEHLDFHRDRGDLVPDRTYERIKEEYQNLDSKIEEYK
jgi:transcriptional regulator of met regulon